MGQGNVLPFRCQLLAVNVHRLYIQNGVGLIHAYIDRAEQGRKAPGRIHLLEKDKRADEHQQAICQLHRAAEVKDNGATNNYKTEDAFFECSLHWKHKEKCSAHFIREKVLNHLVLRHIQLVTGYILRHQQHFISVMEQHLRVESSEKMEIARKQLERNEKRISELKQLFIKIYEDNAKGKLSDERFDMMSQTYEAEQKQLEAEVITLRKDLAVQQRQNENIEQFIQKAHKYVGIEELDPYALRELVKTIYVDAPVKINGKRTQHIHIQYNGIGFIPLDELLKEETA